jgi:hypothetical protein
MDAEAELRDTLAALESLRFETSLLDAVATRVAAHLTREEEVARTATPPSKMTPQKSKAQQRPTRSPQGEGRGGGGELTLAQKMELALSELDHVRDAISEAKRRGERCEADVEVCPAAVDFESFRRSWSCRSGS